MPPSPVQHRNYQHDLLHRNLQSRSWHTVIRETVAGLLRKVRRDAGGRELRGLAWRMGIAPLG